MSIVQWNSDKKCFTCNVQYVLLLDVSAKVAKQAQNVTNARRVRYQFTQTRQWFEPSRGRVSFTRHRRKIPSINCTQPSIHFPAMNLSRCWKNRNYYLKILIICKANTKILRRFRPLRYIHTVEKHNVNKKLTHKNTYLKCLKK